MSPPRLFDREFLTLLLATSAYFVGVGALNALLPLFIVNDLGGSEATAGTVMGSAAISALSFRFFIGRVADRNGARRLIVGGALLAVVAMGLLVLADSVMGVVAARLALGGSGASMVVGTTTLALQIAPVERRGQATSLVLVAFHVGLGIGPLAGEWLLRRMSFDPIWGLVAVAAMVSVLLALLLPHRPGDPSGGASPLLHRNAVAPGVVTLLGVFAFNGFILFASLYAREIGLNDAGLVFLTASGTIAFVRVVFGGVPDRVGPIPAGTFALSVTVVAALVLAFWATASGLYIGAALLAVGLSLQSPSFVQIAIAGVSERERGSVMATYTGFFDIASFIVGPVLGLVVTRAGYRPAFLTSAAIATVALVFYVTVIGPRWYRTEAGMTGPGEAIA